MTDESFVIEGLSQEGFVMVNERLLRALQGNLYAAFLLEKLISKYQYYRKTGMIDQQGWFFQKVDDVENATMINDYKQRAAFAYLKEIGMINMRYIGRPPLRYFQINFSAIKERVDLKQNDFNYPQLSEDKKEFYRNLNAKAYSDVYQFREACGNIPTDTSDFMFAWSLIWEKAMGSRFQWDGRGYGILNNYWKIVYRGKKSFDYNSLWGYFQLIKVRAPKIGIPDFIEFDRERPETFIRMTYAEFIHTVIQGRQDA
jgi:hypothetical protein